MSIFSWLFPKSAPPQSSALPPDELTAPLQGSEPSHSVPGTLGDLKYQRHERREQLYSVVRSVMLRSEVLASHYKFKVLSLDTRGRQFLIMVDLMDAHALHPDRWAPVEQLIAMTAAQRHDLQVKAVYWRLAEPMVSAVGTHAVTQARAPIVTPPPVAPPPRATVTGKPAGRFDPIGQDEVLAFKKAISEATPDASEPPEPGKVFISGPRHSVPMTGYEDTQLLEPDDAVSPLSRTQFGDL